MGVNLWNKLTNGIDRPVVNHKRKLWYECIPGIMAFPAVTFGRKRKLWFRETEYLVIYRDNTYKESHCVIAWIQESQLIIRYTIDNFKLLDYHLEVQPAIKDAIINTNIE